MSSIAQKLKRKTKLSQNRDPFQMYYFPTNFTHAKEKLKEKKKKARSGRNIVVVATWPFPFSRGSRGFTLPISRGGERVAGGRLSGVAGVVNNNCEQPCAGQPIWPSWPSRLARLPVFWDPWLPWEERRRWDRVAQPSIISCDDKPTHTGWPHSLSRLASGSRE